MVKPTQDDVVEQHRLLAKMQKRLAKQGTNTSLFVPNDGSPVDCACLIHGTAYDWSYVDKLYNMLTRNLTRPVRLHVYTEHHRPVPDYMIKHQLIDWGISGPKQSWWYKLQLFNTDFHRGPLLYFDLDTVIVGNIDWIWQLNLRHFWCVRDFKYLWRPSHYGINSSIMWWNTTDYTNIWQAVQNGNVRDLMKKYHGDQDFITDAIGLDRRRFFNAEWVKSWRWQCLDGGYNFSRKKHNYPGTGTLLEKDTSVLVFHGQPKPSDISDPIVIQHWQ